MNFRRYGERLGVLRPLANPDQANPPYIPLKSIEEMNNELTEQEKHSFMYLDLEAELGRLASGEVEVEAA